MNIVASIGLSDASIRYTDRPTVKIIIKKDDTILLLNNGLLPGGGVNRSESDSDAISREIHEELGLVVTDVKELGTVIQYRDFLKQRYIINGYTATLDSTGGSSDPQDAGEAQFIQTWLTVNDAFDLVSRSISTAEVQPVDDDTNQGRFYNLMTTYELIKQLKIKC